MRCQCPQIPPNRESTSSTMRTFSPSLSNSEVRKTGLGSSEKRYFEPPSLCAPNKGDVHASFISALPSPPPPFKEKVRPRRERELVIWGALSSMQMHPKHEAKYENTTLPSTLAHTCRVPSLARGKCLSRFQIGRYGKEGSCRAGRWLKAGGKLFPAELLGEWGGNCGA